MTTRQDAVALTDSDFRALEFEAIDLFSPGAPINEDDLFAGRAPQISKIIEAVLQRGKHAIVYGERGVGKTSLARTFTLRILKPAGRTVSSVLVNCDPGDSFTSLWRKVFKDLSSPDGNLADDYAGDITPDDIRREFSTFELTTTAVVILDEFDKLQDQLARSLIANTIKALSDHSVRATIVLVGVASSVADLISEHQSISRALTQVQMPRMNNTELQEIIDKRLRKLGMTIDKPALAQIVALSRGLPHYTHLLGQFSARKTLQAHALNIEEAHVELAKKECLREVDQSIREQYHSATHSPRGGNIYKEVLLACALAEPDEFGFFPPKAIESPLSIIMSKRYDVPMFGVHLKRLCESDRGSILEFVGSPRRFRYRFVEPLMQPYILLRGVADGIIDKATLDETIPNYLQPRLSSEF